MKVAANSVRPVSIEMGGRNAAAVFADCDCQATIDTLTRSCFENATQVCLGTEHVYVEHSIVDMVPGLQAKAEGMKPGLRTSFGGSTQPGMGREGGVHLVKFHTEMRNVMIKFLPFPPD